MGMFEYLNPKHLTTCFKICYSHLFCIYLLHMLVFKAQLNAYINRLHLTKGSSNKC